MKLKLAMLSIAFLAIAQISFGQSKTDSVKVWGNCDACKKKIEKAATEAGATEANWNEESKILVVTYDAAKTTNLDIQKK